MKKFLILGVVLIAVFFIGWAEWPGTGTIKGDKTFQDSTTFNGDVVHEGTVTFAPGWMEFDQLKPATNDSASSSLGLPNNPYAKAYICSLGVITWVDTVPGNLVVDGAVKPKVIQQSIFPTSCLDDWTTGTQNTISSVRCAMLGFVSFDSIYADSITFAGAFVEDTNLIDSVWVQTNVGRTYIGSTILADGTNWGRSSGTYGIYTYPISSMIPASAKLYIRFKPSAESAANKGKITNIIFYGHPK